MLEHLSAEDRQPLLLRACKECTALPHTTASINELSTLASCRSSVVRNFRALATLTAGQLVTSWVRAMVTLTEARDTAQRQLDAEQRKGSKQARWLPRVRRSAFVVTCNCGQDPIQQGVDWLVPGL